MNAPANSAGDIAAAWSLELDAERIGWLTLDRPGSSTNVLSRCVLVEGERAIAGLAGQGLRGLVIRSAKPSGFIAGADIREFTTLGSEAAALEHVRLGQRVCAALEALPFPTVALLHGYALGGGLELALACRYRLALDDGKLALGLPEVQLGIHPGFGGTVRSVRVLGVRAAMGLMLGGRNVRAAEALRIGLVDRLLPDAAALPAAARAVIAAAPAPRRAAVSDRILGWPGVRRWLRASLERRVAARAPRAHYPAPYAIIELWVRYGASGPRAYEAEAQSIAQLFHSATRTQPDPRVPAAGPPEGAGRPQCGPDRARARRRRRRHGRRYRGLVRPARTARHAAGPGAAVHRTGARARRARCTRSVSRIAGSATPPSTGCSRTSTVPARRTPISSSRPSSRTSLPSARCMRWPSRACAPAPCSRPIPRA